MLYIRKIYLKFPTLENKILIAEYGILLYYYDRNKLVFFTDFWWNIEFRCPRRSYDKDVSIKFAEKALTESLWTDYGNQSLKRMVQINGIVSQTEQEMIVRAWWNQLNWNGGIQ